MPGFALAFSWRCVRGCARPARPARTAPQVAAWGGAAIGPSTKRRQYALLLARGRPVTFSIGSQRNILGGICAIAAAVRAPLLARLRGGRHRRRQPHGQAIAARAGAHCHTAARGCLPGAGQMLPAAAAGRWPRDRHRRSPGWPALRSLKAQLAKGTCPPSTTTGASGAGTRIPPLLTCTGRMHAAAAWRCRCRRPAQGHRHDPSGLLVTGGPDARPVYRLRAPMDDGHTGALVP